MWDVLIVLRDILLLGGSLVAGAALIISARDSGDGRYVMTSIAGAILIAASLVCIYFKKNEE